MNMKSPLSFISMKILNTFEPVHTGAYVGTAGRGCGGAIFLFLEMPKPQ